MMMILPNKIWLTNVKGRKFYFFKEKLLYTVELKLGRAVTQSVEASRYKPEGRGFDSRWCHCNFSLT